MKTKRFLAAVLCAMLLTALLPTMAFAANGFVTIKGDSILNAMTPYYFNDNGTSDSPIKGGKDWNAYLEIKDGEYTLHINALSIENISEKHAIETNNIDTLYLHVEGTLANKNKLSTSNVDSGAAVIKCSNLIVNGGGELEAGINVGDGYGINASSIKLQYPATLTVSGGSSATNVQVECSEGANTYKAKHSSSPAELTDYFTEADAFMKYDNVCFEPKEHAKLPVWVDGSQFTHDALSLDIYYGGSATYTPARGASPAILTLYSATINRTYTSGSSSAGIYTTEPLEIYLSGSSTIGLTTPSSGTGSVYGVFADGADLTITADAGASLVSRVTASSGSGIDCYGIRAGGKVTVNSGDITADGLANTGSGAGIYSDSTLIVKGGVVTAECEGGGANTYAVRAQALTLGTGLAINTPVGGKAPKTDSSGTKDYIMDSNENGATNVVIDRALYTVTYDANGGTGTMTSGTATDGTAFTMPACTFTAPAGQRFKEWAIGSTTGTTVAAGGTHTFTADTTVYAIWENIPAVIDTVTVSPATASVEKGGTKSFSATVTGTNSPAQTVTWTVEGGVASTIDANGKLTVGAAETAATLTVRATSTVDTSKSGTATVTVTVSPTPSDPDPIQYQITEGQYGEWTQGGTGGLGFTADGEYAKFTGVAVDGTVISGDKYTDESGSTIVTLKASYLRTLTVGQHTLRINFTDGYAETNFTIKAATDNPPTGDSSLIWLWLGTAAIAMAGLTVCAVLFRRRRQMH